jgi:hypothetical protein
MRGHEAQIEATLRAVAALPPEEDLVATWSGYLIEFLPERPLIEPPLRPTAVLAVSGSALYLIAETGLLRTDFDHLRGPHSPYPDVLRFSVSDGHDDPVLVTIAIHGANAIAGQLNHAMSRCRASVPRPRTRAKRRSRAADRQP